jgi:hypothetical protein
LPEVLPAWVPVLAEPEQAAQEQGFLEGVSPPQASWLVALPEAAKPRVVKARRPAFLEVAKVREPRASSLVALERVARVPQV